MKNKNGFTLVELLAVIAILAILMLLIMPNILRMFNSGKKDAFKVQIESIIKTAEKQKQTDMFNNNVTNVYCSGIDASCQGNLKLDINDTGAKYGVVFENNKVVGVALEDSNYCYVNNTDVTDINPDDFVEGGKLSCTGGVCICTGATRYVYWTISEGGSGTSYRPTSKPTNTFNSLASMNLTGVEKLIRTTIDSDNNVLGHEACLYYNSKLFCLDNNYWVSEDANGTLTKAKLAADMESTLGVKPSCSNLDTSRTDCYYGTSVRCKVSKGNEVLCANASSGSCNVFSNGYARCI